MSEHERQELLAAVHVGIISIERVDGPAAADRRTGSAADSWRGVHVLNDPGAAMTELPPAIAGDILRMPELSDPEWYTSSIVAEVTDHYVARPEDVVAV